MKTPWDSTLHYTRKMQQDSSYRPSVSTARPAQQQSRLAAFFVSPTMPLLFYFCSWLAAVTAALLLRGLHPGYLGDLANFMGPLAENLAHGRRYMVCSNAMTSTGNMLCFHANRMPFPPFLLALLIDIFGDHFLTVELAKIALVLLPVSAAVTLAGKQAQGASNTALRVVILALLFVSLILPTQLIDVINMQVEEGYSFCLLTYALAALLFGIRQQVVPWTTTIFFALSVLALYLTKSSMIAAVAFLVFAFCLLARDTRKRIAVLLIALCGPFGWGMYTLRATGHFSVGTSLDGINLHKGNYAQFLDHYPPAPGSGLDQYDQALSKDKYFSSEWTFNTYHMHAAEAYMRSHPGRTMTADLRKSDVFFLSLRKIGSANYSGWLGRITDVSMLLFRLLFWGACALAIWLLVRGPGNARWSAVVYLGTVCAVAAPYLAGFALTRHAGVLCMPSALFLCWWMIRCSVHKADQSGEC